MKRFRQFVHRGFVTGAKAFKFAKDLEKKLTWFMVFFTLMSPVFGFTISYLTSLIANKIQVAVSSKASTNVSTLLLAFVTTLLVSSLFERIKRYVNAIWKTKIRNKVAEKRRLKRVSLDVAMIKSEHFETLVRRIEEAPLAWGILDDLSLDQFEIISTIVSFSISVTLVSMFSFGLAVLLMILSLPQLFADLHCSKLFWKMVNERAVLSKRRDEASSCFGGMVALLETKLFQSMPFLWNIINEYQDRRLEEIKSLEKKRLWMAMAGEFIFVGGLIYCMYQVSMSAARGEILIGTMMLVMLSGFSGLRSNTRQFLMQISKQHEQSRYLQDVEDFFALKPMYSPVATPKTLITGSTLEIVFRNVWFRYDTAPEGVFAIRELNLTIKAGEKVGVFGENGSGKSTLVSLLCGFYHPTKGDIFVNGVNMKDMPQDHWAHFLSVLLQSHTIPDFLVREVIGLTEVGADQTAERLNRAAEYAGANEVIGEFPNGFETQLGQGQGGVELSGGQAKRIAIAARMFPERPLVIFDEPENKLDAHSKELLFSQLSKLSGDVTAIFVSHSLETLGLANRILVFDQGKLVEDGPSETLLQNEASLYRKAMTHAWKSMQSRMNALRKVAPQLFIEEE